MNTQTFNLPSEAIISKAFLKVGRTDVIKWDVLPISDTCSFILTFEDWTKGDRHGVWIKVEGELVVNGISSQSMEIWADTAPSSVVVEVRKSQGALHVYNIWDSGTGKQSQSYTSGMLAEDLPNGRRYRCNDIGLDPKFDSLVFRIEREGQSA